MHILSRAHQRLRLLINFWRSLDPLTFATNSKLQSIHRFHLHFHHRGAEKTSQLKPNAVCVVVRRRNTSEFCLWVIISNSLIRESQPKTADINSGDLQCEVMSLRKHETHAIYTNLSILYLEISSRKDQHSYLLNWIDWGRRWGEDLT